jgi:hypothetical protein
LRRKVVAMSQAWMSTKYLIRLSFLALVFSPAPAVADGSSLRALEVAQADVRAREYQRAVSATRTLLESMTLSTVEEIILAHKILGVSYCETGEQAKAAEHFDHLLTFSPTEDIGDLVVTKPCAEMYTDMQKQSADPPSKPAGATQPHPSSARSPAAPLPISSPQSGITSGDGIWLRLLPFGTGQFANEQDAKGMAFLSTEIALSATATTFALLFRNERQPNGSFPDPGRATLYKDIFWSSLGVGIGTAVWGIIDALVVQNRHKRAPLKPALAF